MSTAHSDPGSSLVMFGPPAASAPHRGRRRETACGFAYAEESVQRRQPNLRPIDADAAVAYHLAALRLAVPARPVGRRGRAHVFGSAIVEVAIGLVFIYFVLAAIVSHVNELLAGLFSWRATLLEDGIRNLVADPNLADRVLTHPLVSRLTGKPTRRPSYISSDLFAQSLFDALVPPPGTPSLAAIETSIANLPVGSAKDTLMSVLSHAQGGLDEKRKAVEDWYDAAMDRLSGVYKRQVQLVTLALGAFVVVLLGVDSVAIAATLWQEQGIRAALAGAAQQASAAGLEDAVNTLSEFALPIGWLVYPGSLVEWVTKIAGLATTVFAVSLGAPFWFDLLNHFTNVRASGPKPQTRLQREGTA